jgi:hypothetical protein
MTLSDHDLTQLNTSYLDTLPEDNLRSLSKKLLVDLKEARERLTRTPETSSVPPSSREPWKSADTKETPHTTEAIVDDHTVEPGELGTTQTQDSQTPQKPPIQRLSQPRKRGGNQDGAKVVKVIVASLPWKSPE